MNYFKMKISPKIILLNYIVFFLQSTHGFFFLDKLNKGTKVDFDKKKLPPKVFKQKFSMFMAFSLFF